MGLLARTKYLAGLVVKAKKIIKPIEDEYLEVTKTIDEIKSNFEEKIAKVMAQIEAIKNPEILKELREKQKELEQELEKQLGLIFKNFSDSVERFVSSMEVTIDGITIKPEFDLVSRRLSFGIEPKLFNLESDFLKDTIQDPSTKVVVNTVLSGTAGPYTIIGTGTQLSPIITT